MSKPARGIKRVCPSCGARFYDLSRTPIVCPVCQTVYQVTPAPSRRSERAAPVETRKPVEEEVEQPARETAQVISLEEAEEEESNVEVAEDEEIVDLGEEGAEIPADEDDTFLEEEEEGEADVSGIVGGGKEEET